MIEPENEDWFFGPTYGWRNYQNTSSLVLLLPYLEKDEIYVTLPKICSAINQTYEAYRAAVPGQPEWIGDLPEVADSMHTRIALFECPSDTAFPGETTRFVVATQPHMVKGAFGEDLGDWFGPGYSTDDGEIAPTNYLGCSGAHSGGETPDPDRRPYTGVMSCKRKIALHNIRDGTSHTVMYGETVGWIQKGIRAGNHSWFFGGLARGRNMWPWRGISLTPETDELFGDANYSMPAGFGSKHTMMVHFAMADGSVRGIPRDINWPELYALTGAFDGVLVTGF
jgi:hypothetical protein